MAHKANPKQGESLADKLGNAAAARHAPPVEGDSVSRDNQGETETLDIYSTRIRTVEQALAKAEVDVSMWEVERFVVNSWEVGAKGPDKIIRVTPLWQVKVWLKKKKGFSPEEFRALLLADMDRHSPKYPAAPARPKARTDSLLFVAALFDHHIGKLCWHAETGTDYDLKICRTLYSNAIDDMIERLRGVSVQTILFPVGNDFLHADNKHNTTTKGTPVDVDGRWQKAFVLAREMTVEAAEKFAAIAPVEIPIIPGNHDRERMFYLGDTIASHFRHSKAIAVDNRPLTRKYFKHGAVLLGLTHGCDEKDHELPRLMLDEARDLIPGTVCREWLLGHLHKKKETHYVGADTFGGTVVRRIPSLSGTDDWHFRMGYVKTARASEGLLYHTDKGYWGHIHVPARESQA